MSETLPVFRYHPDPISTGSVIESEGECAVCGRARGFAYDGPVYGEDEPEGEICPWCIADGSAASRFGLEFTDAGWGVPDDVPESVVANVSSRTPGFAAFEQDHWLYHCGDACAYQGLAGDDQVFECLKCGQRLTFTDRD